MAAYLFRRLLWAAAVVVMATTFVFFLEFGVGDIAVSLGPNASPAARQEFREQNGVDKPWLVYRSFTVDGTDTRDADREVLGRSHAALLRCHREGVIRDPDHDGNVDLRLAITPAGTVREVTVDAASSLHDGISGCIENHARDLHFPRGENAAPSTLAATIHFDTVSLLHQFTSYLGIAKCLRTRAEDYHPSPDQNGRCGILQGDLGQSFSHDDSVSATIGRRLPRTLLLGSMTIFFELLIGLLIGVVAAVYRNTWFDTAVMGTAFLGISLPTFVSGLLFLFYFAFLLGFFPVGGFGTSFWDHVYHGLLPAFTLAIIGAATYARIMRSEMIETLGADYVRTARAKGLSSFRTIVVHGMRNGLLPVVTIAGLNLRIIVSGAIITETIFAWPGIGSLAVESISGQDAFTVVGIVLIVAFTVQAGNLLADIAVAALDPRVRLESSGTQ